MDTSTLHLAPKAVRLAIARALIDKAAGDAGKRVTGERAAARHGVSSRRERSDTGIDRIRMMAGDAAAGGAGPEEQATEQ